MTCGKQIQNLIVYHVRRSFETYKYGEISFKTSFLHCNGIVITVLDS